MSGVTATRQQSRPARRPAAPGRASSSVLPFVAGDAGLPPHAREEADPDIATVRVRDGEDQVPLRHELMTAAAVGPVEAERAQTTDELAAWDRTPARHQPAFWTLTSMSPSGGTASPRATRTRTHSS